MNVRSQDRRYIHCSGASAHLSFSDVNLQALEGARAVYVGGFFALPSFNAAQLAMLFYEARRRGLMTILDVVIPAGTRPSLDELGNVLPLTDAFLPNHDEAQVLTGQEDPLGQAELLSRVNPDCAVVITLGRSGAVGRRGREVIQASAFKVDSIDESGGGDAFDAGFIVGQLEGWSLEESLRFASAAGASCSRAIGCHDGVFTFDEARDFIARNSLAISRIS
jgi:sugar/nucleoside kinase (ribokinase family)